MTQRLKNIVALPTVVPVDFKVASAVHRAASYMFDDDGSDDGDCGHNEPPLPSSYVALDDDSLDGMSLPYQPGDHVLTSPPCASDLLATVSSIALADSTTSQTSLAPPLPSGDMPRTSRKRLRSRTRSCSPDAGSLGTAPEGIPAPGQARVKTEGEKTRRTKSRARNRQRHQAKRVAAKSDVAQPTSFDYAPSSRAVTKYGSPNFSKLAINVATAIGIARAAFTSKKIALERTDPYTKAEIESRGLRGIPWDGRYEIFFYVLLCVLISLFRTPQVLADLSRLMLVILAGHPDDPAWHEVQANVQKAFEAASDRAQPAYDERRGTTPVTTGVSFGGGQKVRKTCLFCACQSRLTFVSTRAIVDLIQRLRRPLPISYCKIRLSNGSLAFKTVSPRLCDCHSLY
jgi:hypothetical protein